MEDYEELTVVLRLAPCEKKQCLNAIIIDDNVNEPQETFSLNITDIPSSFILNSTATDIVITDDDGELHYQNLAANDSYIRDI